MASDAEAVVDDVVKTVDKAADAADADVDPVKAAMQREAERRNAQLSGLPYTWVVIDSPQEERDGTFTTYEGELVLYDMNKFAINNLWIMIAGCMVFLMHLGFATQESGMTRAKNTVNILFKNSMIVCLGILMYFFIGFRIMYPLEGDWIIDGVFGLGFGLGMALYFASMGAGRMAWPATAGMSRIVIAVGGGALLAGPLGLGLDGQFIAVALGITAYGAIVAAAVRPGVWSASSIVAIPVR
jgi:hypothetical protein